MIFSWIIFVTYRQVLLDEDLGDKIARNHEEHVDSDEPAIQEQQPSLEDDQNSNCDGSQSVDVRSVGG